MNNKLQKFSPIVFIIVGLLMYGITTYFKLQETTNVRLALLTAFILVGLELKNEKKFRN